MIPVIPPAVCAIGLIGSLILGSMGISNLVDKPKPKPPETVYTSSWPGYIRGIMNDYNKAKKSKGKKSIWLNIDEKKFEKAFGIKPNKEKK
jgi:hypothetical protein